MKKIYEFKPTAESHEVPGKKKETGKPKPKWKKIMHLSKNEKTGGYPTPKQREAPWTGKETAEEKIAARNKLQKFQDWMQKQNYASTSTVLTPTFGGAGPGEYYQENTKLNKHQTDKTHAHVNRWEERKEIHYANKPPTIKPLKKDNKGGQYKKEFVEKQIKNPFAVATSQAKKLGFKDFSQGSKGREKRDEIAETLKPGITKYDMFMEWMEKHNPKSRVFHKHPGPGKGVKAIKKKIPKEFSLKPSGSSKDPFIKRIRQAEKIYSTSGKPIHHQAMLDAFRAWEKSKMKQPKQFLETLKHPMD